MLHKCLMLVLAIGLMPSLNCTALAADALSAVNTRRVSLGLYALKPDAKLQAHAEWASQTRARRHVTGHLGQTYPGSSEGVGYGYREFRTCYHKPNTGDPSRPAYTRRHRWAGAAVAYDNRGRPYYTLVLSGRQSSVSQSPHNVSSTRHTGRMKGRRRFRLLRNR